MTYRVRNVQTEEILKFKSEREWLDYTQSWIRHQKDGSYNVTLTLRNNEG